MANEMKIANGLILDFDLGAAGGTDTFLMRNTTSDRVTELSSVPASRISSGGDLTEATSSVLTITGGTGAVLSGITIQVKLAATGQSGYLSSTDWNTFNNKQSTALADGKMWVGNGSGVAAAVTMSGDVTITNAGVAAIGTGVIVNADINASAAIAFTKMAAFAGTNLVLATDGSGFVTTVTGLTTTIAGYLTNISSDVQAQFTTTNERIVNIATNAIVRTPTAAQTGYAIIWDNSAAEWTLGPVGGGGSITGAGSSTDNAISRWNGTGGTSIQDSGVIIDDSNNITGVASLTLGTAGLHLLDTNASHDLIVSVGTDLSADRTLTVTTGDADRTITLSGNPTLSDWFDQSVKAAASPVFSDVTLSNVGGLHILDSDDSHDLVLRTTSNLTADRELIFVTGDATRTLTINASGTLYVTGGTDVAVADGGTGLSAIAALSILVANSANTYVALTPGAGNSLRVNAGGTAWEAYTPSGGGISGLTATRVSFAASATALDDDARFFWNDTDKRLAVGATAITGTITLGHASQKFVSIAAESTNGSDDMLVMVNGYGSASQDNGRGASIFAAGNENITYAGKIVMAPGNAANSSIDFYDSVGSGSVSFRFVASNGNIGMNGATSFGSGAGVMGIKNAATPSSGALTDGILIYAQDSGDSLSTLALYTEQTAEATATFTQTNRLKIRHNGTEYWIPLDAV